MENLSFEKSPADKKEGEKEHEQKLMWKLNYIYSFPSGENLEAFQDEQGIAGIVIRKENKIIFDASKLLPKDWKFVTPTYFENFIKEGLADYLIVGGWEFDPKRKVILMGEFKSPQDILVLLHEIGHAKNITFRKQEWTAFKKIRDEHRDINKSKPHYISLWERQAKAHSKLEEDAWAWAVLTLRKIQRETGIDFQSIFPTPESLKKYINKSLAVYGEYYRNIILGHDPDFDKEFKKLFDRYDYGGI